MFAIRNQIKTEEGVKYFFFGDYDKGHPLKKDIKFLLQHLKQIVVFRNIHKLYCTWHIISPTVIDFKTYLFLLWNCSCDDVSTQILRKYGFIDVNWYGEDYRKELEHIFIRGYIKKVRSVKYINDLINQYGLKLDNYAIDFNLNEIKYKDKYELENEKKKIKN